MLKVKEQGNFKRKNKSITSTSSEWYQVQGNVLSFNSELAIWSKKKKNTIYVLYLNKLAQLVRMFKMKDIKFILLSARLRRGIVRSSGQCVLLQSFAGQNNGLCLCSFISESLGLLPSAIKAQGIKGKKTKCSSQAGWDLSRKVISFSSHFTSPPLCYIYKVAQRSSGPNFQFNKLESKKAAGRRNFISVSASSSSLPGTSPSL